MPIFKPAPEFQLQGACALPHFGLIRCAGDDAASFLHNQLTHDLLLLADGQARLAGFCNAQGRLQASMLALKLSPQEVWLVMRQDLLARTLKRLSMFVLRSKVKLTDASAEFKLWGLSGEPARAAQAATGCSSPWQASAFNQGHLVSLYPAADMPRCLWIGQQDFASAAPIGLSDWLAGEVLSGVADVSEAIFEMFIPQMLNYESVDGVSFKKGCYPGQEVVARSQFRGSLKRRGFLVQSPQMLQAGQEIMSVSGESCGTVAQAACYNRPDGEPVYIGLACLLLSHLNQIPFQLLQMPYSLKEDI